MNALIALPYEIQDYIFEFDGRYKATMSKCANLVKEWGKTAIHGNYSWAKDSPILFETERRAAMYTRHLTDDDVIQMRHRVIETRKLVGFHYLFRDVFGVYSVLAKPRVIMVDGEEYKSTKYYKYIGALTMASSSDINSALRTKTRESRFYLLDPKVQKKLRRTNSFLEHGLSPNGKRVKKVFKSAKPAFVFNPATDSEVIDGTDYYMRNGDIISMDGRIVGAVDGEYALWLGDAR
jgi:hypothetical protein